MKTLFAVARVRMTKDPDRIVKVRCSSGSEADRIEALLTPAERTRVAFQWKARQLEAGGRYAA
jgi:hypothetical protein